MANGPSSDQPGWGPESPDSPTRSPAQDRDAPVPPSVSGPQQRINSSLLPPHQRDFITRVPVTPGVAPGTYEHRKSGGETDHEPFTPGYFDKASSSCQLPTSLTVSPETEDGDVKLSGNIISATFTVPHALKFKGSDWELKHRYHQSAHLDSLAYLSSKESPWDHTIIAWTGEITHSEHDEQASDMLAGAAPKPAPIAHMMENQHSDEVFITHDGQSKLERQLYSDELKTIPIWLADDSEITQEGIRLKDQARWRRYAEHDLCALFHYRQHPPTVGRKDDSRWTDFRRMNEAFADKICDIYKPGDIVMVHDYYLMLLPALLRQRRPGVYIAFFLHSPFPTSELVRCLARRNEVLEGVLGSNLVGFQTFHYAQHFATCCTRILGYPANMEAVNTPRARIDIGVFPAGINASKITSLAWTQSVDDKCATLRGLHEGKKIIIGCDPLDSLGGVDKKMMAFERFLDRYPEWQDKVVLLQITSPTTAMEDDDGEARFANRVNELVNSVNTQHGSLGYQPVQNHSQHLTPDEHFALLRCGDVALITCVRDGMSMTGLEYVVCQRDARGPLIISEFSGTASCLEEAIRINPWDVGRVADEIYNALTMEEGRRRDMHQAIYARVIRENIAFWVNSILRRLVHVIGAPDLETWPPPGDEAPS